MIRSRIAAMAPAVAVTLVLSLAALPPAQAAEAEAAAKPKSLLTTVTLDCFPRGCTATFAAAKRRQTVDWINCVINVHKGDLISGTVYTDDIDLPIGGMRISGRDDLNDTSINVAEFTNSFDLPARKQLFVTMSTTAAPGGARCTISGVLK